MATSVSGKPVTHFSSLIIPDGQPADVRFTIGSWELRIEIEFTTAIVEPGKPAPSPSISVLSLGQHGKLVFTNWDNSLGTATKEPFEIARSSTGETVNVMVWHAKAGNVNRLDLQFTATKATP